VSVTMSILTAVAFISVVTCLETAGAFQTAFISSRTNLNLIILSDGNAASLNRRPRGNCVPILRSMAKDSLFSPEEDGSDGKVIRVPLETVEFSLKEHKPLGCTIEESLVAHPYNPESMPVFVSKIVSGGNAEKAGLKVGDIIIGVSGVFDQPQDVSGVGLDKVYVMYASSLHSFFMFQWVFYSFFDFTVFFGSIVDLLYLRKYAALKDLQLTCRV